MSSCVCTTAFAGTFEQKVNVDLLSCCKPRLLEQESWGTARNSMDILEKVLEDCENEKPGQEARSDEDTLVSSSMYSRIVPAFLLSSSRQPHN